jgi:long-chain fatty acid transport protein
LNPDSATFPRQAVDKKTEEKEKTEEGQQLNLKGGRREMRKGFTAVGIIVLMVGLASSLQAGGIINKQNLSADYMRTLNRNAATDMADAAAFNPAGPSMMQDGLYLKADALYLWKDYSNNLPSSFPVQVAPGVTLPFNSGGGTFDSEEPSIIPGLFAVYKQGRWAGFFTVTIPGGGGKVRYDDGNSRTMALSANYGALLGTGTNPAAADQFIEADSYYVGYSLGAAYKIFDSLSVSGGVRFVDAYQKFKGYANGPAGSVDVKIERTDEAFNYFLGLDYAPIKDLNVGLTYMSNTPLNFKADTRDSSPGQGISNSVGWTDGTHEREDLPGYIGLGVSYFIIPGTLRIEPNFTYYLEKQAKLEGERFQNSSPGNSYDIGLTLEYILNPQWRFSVGYMHTEIKGMESQDLLTEAPELDADTVGLGLVWSPIERLSLTLSGTRVWYQSRTTDVTNSRGVAGTELDKDVWAVGLGLQYRFF